MRMTLLAGLISILGAASSIAQAPAIETLDVRREGASPEDVVLRWSAAGPADAYRVYRSLDLACSTGGCPAQPGSTVKVTVHGTFALVTPLLAVVFGGTTLPMTASATAQVEYLPPAATATLPPGRRTLVP